MPAKSRGYRRNQAVTLWLPLDFQENEVADRLQVARMCNVTMCNVTMALSWTFLILWIIPGNAWLQGSTLGV